MKHLIIALLLFFACYSNSNSQTIWFELSSNSLNSLHEVQFVSNHTGYAVGENKTILKTTNSGMNWSSLDIGSLSYTPHFYSLHFFNSDTGYVVGSGSGGSGSFHKTTNGGLNWTSTEPYEIVYSVHFVSQAIGYAAGYHINKTINKGNTWSVYGFGDHVINSISFSNINTGYAVGKSPRFNNPVAKMYKTSDAGVNWLAMTPSSPFPLTDIFFVNDFVGYVSSESGRVLKTTNQGNNWISVFVLGITDDFQSLHFVNENTGFVVGEGSTIVKTTDGGASWEALISPSNWTLNDVHFINDNTGYAVGGGGTIIKTTNGSTSFSGIRLNVKSINEGLYFPLFNSLSRKDTMTAYLQSSSFPYSIVDSAKGIIDSTSFSGLFTFNNAPSGTYYIVMKHFQSIETWSKPGGEVLVNNGSIYNYDFTTSSSQAYGNNLKLKGSKYCVYTGDLNQSGFVDATELSMIENDAANFLAGRFVITDLNGDEIVDASDYLIVDNNAYNFVGVVRP